MTRRTAEECDKLIEAIRYPNRELSDETIPEGWLRVASLPIDSPYWHSLEGEEYLDTSDNTWMVLNRKLGEKTRLRFICRIVKVVRVDVGDVGEEAP
jgi:hypothetical protein